MRAVRTIRAGRGGPGASARRASRPARTVKALPAGVTVTAPAHTPRMSTQLRLLEGGSAGRDRLDKRTRAVGRKGVAAARTALRNARPPEPVKPLRRAG